MATKGAGRAIEDHGSLLALFGRFGNRLGDPNACLAGGLLYYYDPRARIGRGDRRTIGIRSLFYVAVNAMSRIHVFVAS